MIRIYAIEALRLAAAASVVALIYLNIVAWMG